MTVTEHAPRTEAAIAPYIAGDRVIFRRDPATQATVTGCTLTARGWSVSWRADPAVPGVRPAEGCCPADALMPATALWMCPVFSGRIVTGAK